MATTETLSDTARDIQNRVGPQLEEARRELDSLNQRVSGFIRERPIASWPSRWPRDSSIGRIALADRKDRLHMASSPQNPAGNGNPSRASSVGWGT